MKGNNGLSFKTWIIICLLLTPLMLCMPGGPVAVTLFWLLIGFLKFIVPMIKTEMWIKSLDKGNDSEPLAPVESNEEFLARIDARRRANGLVTEGELREICDNYGFTLEGKYSLRTMDMTVRTHKTRRQLAEMGLTNSKQIFEKFGDQLGCTPFTDDIKLAPTEDEVYFKIFTYRA